MGSSDGNRLRLARLARGLSQAELAEGAGISRQAVAGVEAGRWDPSLRVALALSQALGVVVEELFGPERPFAEIQTTSLGMFGGAKGQSRVTLSQVGARTVAVPMQGNAAMRAGFLPATASVGKTLDIAVPFTTSRPTLVIAGCDPALPLLEEPLSRLDPPIGFTWWPCGSEAALKLAQAGVVHAAGAHLKDGTGQGYNGEAARRLLEGTGAEVLHFARWREGFAVSANLAQHEGDLAYLVERKARFVNRELGSEARSVFERERSRLAVDVGDIVGYESEAKGHLQVACAIEARLADAGVVSEPAALAFGLGFWPLTEERYDLVLPRPLLGTPEVQGLLRVLASTQLKAQLNSIVGYAVSDCGEVVDSF